MDVDEEQEKAMIVAVRIRPLSKKEIGAGAQPCCQVLDDRMVAIRKVGDANGYLKSQQSIINEYAYDAVFDESSTQQSVYDQTAKKFIPNVINGKNVTVFAYGATGAGKTHTMLGNTRADNSASNADNDAGIIPNAVKDVFNNINARHENPFYEGHRYSISLSYIEVYNEQVYDLLDKSGKVLSVREDQERGIVVVAGVTEQPVSSYEEVIERMILGNRNRKTEATLANAVSSRSHAVLQLVVKHTSRNDFNGKEVMIESKLSLIDLAGSERAAATNNRGVRLQEGANINKSLLALANCINALAENANNSANGGSSKNKLLNVKYRDSKLTHLLKSSLEGNCNLIMIANINPSDATYEDSHNTLKYANRAKNIKVNPIVKEQGNTNTNWVEREMKLREENTQLRSKLVHLNQVVQDLQHFKTTVLATITSFNPEDSADGTRVMKSLRRLLTTQATSAAAGSHYSSNTLNEESVEHEVEAAGLSVILNQSEDSSCISLLLEDNGMSGSVVNGENLLMDSSTTSSCNNDSSFEMAATVSSNTTSSNNNNNNMVTSRNRRFGGKAFHAFVNDDDADNNSSSCSTQQSGYNIGKISASNNNNNNNISLSTISCYSGTSRSMIPTAASSSNSSSNINGGMVITKQQLQQHNDMLNVSDIPSPPLSVNLSRGSAQEPEQQLLDESIGNDAITGGGGGGGGGGIDQHMNGGDMIDPADVPVHVTQKRRTVRVNRAKSALVPNCSLKAPEHCASPIGVGVVGDRSDENDTLMGPPVGKMKKNNGIKKAPHRIASHIPNISNTSTSGSSTSATQPAASTATTLHDAGGAIKRKRGATVSTNIEQSATVMEKKKNTVAAVAANYDDDENDIDGFISKEQQEILEGQLRAFESESLSDMLHDCLYEEKEKVRGARGGKRAKRAATAASAAANGIVKPVPNKSVLTVSTTVSGECCSYGEEKEVEEGVEDHVDGVNLPSKKKARNSTAPTSSTENSGSKSSTSSSRRSSVAAAATLAARRRISTTTNGGVANGVAASHSRRSMAMAEVSAMLNSISTQPTTTITTTASSRCSSAALAVAVPKAPAAMRSDYSDDTTLSSMQGHQSSCSATSPSTEKLQVDRSSTTTHAAHQQATRVTRSNCSSEGNDNAVMEEDSDSLVAVVPVERVKVRGGRRGKKTVQPSASSSASTTSVASNGISIFVDENLQHEANLEVMDTITTNSSSNNSNAVQAPVGKNAGAKTKNGKSLASGKNTTKGKNTLDPTSNTNTLEASVWLGI